MLEERGRVAITKMHSALLNTCSHLFQMTDTLCLASQSLGRPDLISFRSLAWNSNLLIPALNHNSSLLPDTPQQNSNYQLPLLLSVCDGSWPIITWSHNKAPWRVGRLQLFVTWGHLWGAICQRRKNSNKTAPKRWDSLVRLRHSVIRGGGSPQNGFMQPPHKRTGVYFTTFY